MSNNIFSPDYRPPETDMKPERKVRKATTVWGPHECPLCKRKSKKLSSTNSLRFRCLQGHVWTILEDGLKVPVGTSKKPVMFMG